MSIRILCSESVVKLICTDSTIKDRLYQDLSFNKDTAQEVSFIDQESNILRGLLPRLLYLLDNKYKLQYTLVDDSFSNVDESLLEKLKPDILSGITLHSHQLVAIRKLISCKRGIIKGAPGAGKTEIWSGFLKLLLHKKSLTILGYATHANQMRERLERRLGIKIGFIGDGSYDIQDHTVGIAKSVFNLVRKNDIEFCNYSRALSIVGWDEVHHLSQSITWQAISHIASPEYSVGLSAYPFVDKDNPYGNPDDTMLIGLTGELLCNLPARYLIDKGYLTEPLINILTVERKYVFVPFETMPGYYQSRFVNKAGGVDWVKVRKEAIVDHYERNLMIIRLINNIVRYHPESRVLALVEVLDHGNYILRVLTKMGVSVVFNSGGGRLVKFENGEVVDAGYSEDEAISKLKSGELRVLIGSVIFDECRDIPFITDLVMCAGGKGGSGYRRNLQRIGRALRTSEGKLNARIWDFYDKHCRVTKNHSEQRFEAYEEESYKLNYEISEEYLF